MKPFSTETERLERREILRLLSETPPGDLVALGEMETLRAFHRIVESVPSYRKRIAASRIDTAKVTDIGAFRKMAPILDKHNTFGSHRISELCTGGNLDGIRTLLTSSGHSGVFSFGVNTQENLSRSTQGIDMGLQYLFNVDGLSTVLINCLPMGVKVRTKATFLAETSVREDMVTAIIKNFAPEFDQIILLGEGSFIKKVVEDGAEYHDIDWPSLRVHVITGEEGIAENYRTYLGNLLGIEDFASDGGKLIGSSMGVAELDLNIFHETRESIRIRRLTHEDEALRHALFGDQAAFSPMFFVYNPQQCYVEELPVENENHELLISMLSPELKIPLLRYRTGDTGKVLSYDHVVQTLRRFGHELQPTLKLPFVAVYGRGKSLPTREGNLFPEAVKEALYGDHDLAASITGNFRISGRENGGALLKIQLRKGKHAVADAEARLTELLARYTPVRPSIEFLRYETFPHAMGVDYERKFAYIG